MTWLWISNPNAFMSKKIFCIFIKSLKTISRKTNLLKVFVLSEDYLELNYQEIDIESTILLYEEQQQLPEFSILKSSLDRHYPDELNQKDEDIISQLFRVFSFIGRSKKYDENVYLRDKDVVLLKVVDELLGYEHPIKYQHGFEDLTELEKKFLAD